MPFCQYKHLNVHYTEAGKGPALVLLHGFLENLRMWDEFIKALQSHYRVVCIDLPGHGLTPNFGYVHTMEDMAHAVKAVLDHLRLRKYALIGHSMGGYVALAFAEFHPDNLRLLGLFYSTAAADSEEQKANRLRAIEAVKHNARTFVRATIPSLFRPKSRKLHKDKINRVKDEALKMNPQGIIAALAGMRERQEREALLHFGPYPVMMVSGKRDPRIPIGSMESQLNAPNTKFKLITPNGHMGHIEDTEACIEFFKHVLKQVS
jgi:pimeloyl-ACP methyl ester carboxylesterase